MGVLVDDFGGKVSGELIRAADWNGMLAAVEALIDGVQQAIDTRLAPLESTVGDLGTRVVALESHVADLTSVAATLRSRYRGLGLTAGSLRFAIGQRGPITATVTSFDGTPLPLDDAAARPWVDFVTSWGTLLPAPGFTSRSGAGGRTVSVQVNASGQATVLLQADHAANFSEAEHAQVESLMATRIQAGGQDISVAESILAGATPTSSDVQPAFRAMTQAYATEGAANTVQRYLDTYYVQSPFNVASRLRPILPGLWTDYLATVLAFVKPDADPLSADGAMAAASIQVTFRDWVRHWIVGDFFAELAVPLREYREIIPGLIHTNLRRSVDGVLDEIDNRSRNLGVLGIQRELEAAMEAVRGISVTNPAPFFTDAVEAVVSGIAVQRAVSYGQSVTPGAGAGPTTARAIADSSAKATDQAARIGSDLTTQFQTALGEATSNLRDQVRADQQVFRAELLRDDGPIALAGKEARDVRGALEQVNRALVGKADLQFVTDFVRRG